MKQDAFFQTIIHHIGGEGNVARKRFDGEHLYVTVKDSGTFCPLPSRKIFWRMLQWQKISNSWRRIS